jgi:NRAMP (natural resistance-associated macrophage protein)-like metal ion transporter
VVSGDRRSARQSGAAPPPRDRQDGVVRALGLGLITGAADDDPSAIGTYAAAGASFGTSILWTAPATFPMMVAVVYLCSKLGQVTGRGLFEVLRERYPRWLLKTALVGVLIGNTIEAGADLGGIAAALALIVPVPRGALVLAVAAALLALQIFGSYQLIRNLFRWLALTLLAYAASAVLARPHLGDVIRGTLLPTLRFDRDYLAILVAVIGTTLSAYLYTWQSNEEVEEEIAMGRRRLHDRVGATPQEIEHSFRDVVIGMFFSNVVMFFIILSTAATLFAAGRHEVASAADAAAALAPLAGRLASLLFAAGIVGVGFLAVPVMTTGAAYDLCQTLGWKHGLHARPAGAKGFYWLIGGFTAVAAAMNFVGINPMKALVWSGVVQGFSTPPLMLLIMLITNDRRVMGEWTNGLAMNVVGWITTAAIFAASAALVSSWLW